MKQVKNMKDERESKPQSSPKYTEEEIRAIIISIRRESEKIFEEELEKMSPEEREKANQMADDLL